MAAYSHVILIGLDGAGNFNRFADTPTMDRLSERGAKCDWVLTSIPSISAECWGSMLTGVSPKEHGLTNEIVALRPYQSEKYPTVFKLIREAMPDAHLGSFSDWSGINNGIVESDLGVTKDTGVDEALTAKICDYIRNEKPTFLFVQYDSVDYAGHHFGYGTEKHLEAISRIDRYIEVIRKTIDMTGIAGDTLLLVSADHGGTGYSHGGETDEEKYVFFIASGDTVTPGAQIELEVKDIPAIIVKALGVPASPNWHAVVPEGLFTE